MRALLPVVTALFRTLIRSRANLFFENAALRQELAVVQQSSRRPKLHASDRVFWVVLSRLWSRWRSVLVIVQPRTVLGGQRQGFRLFRRWKSRGGRPAIEREHRELIRRLSRDNPAWGEDRIRDELRHKLGVQHPASTVRRYMLRPEERGSLGERRQSQTWRRFLRNHAGEIYACDFVTQWTRAAHMLVGERPVLKLMYASLIRGSENWRGIRITEFERRQLETLRAQQIRKHQENVKP